MREKCGHSCLRILVDDAMSLYAVVTATMIKTPAEGSLLSHSQYIRELLDNKVFHAIAWQDTRDMVAYARTKGAAERGLIHSLMDGMQVCRHKFDIWSPRD